MLGAARDLLCLLSSPMRVTCRDERTSVHSTSPSQPCPVPHRSVSVGPPKFLTAAEVQEILRCVWAANADMMQLIYPADVAHRKRRRGASQAQAAAAGKAAAQVQGSRAGQGCWDGIARRGIQGSLIRLYILSIKT